MRSKKGLEIEIHMKGIKMISGPDKNLILLPRFLD
jgi:hypothetical protein